MASMAAAGAGQIAYSAAAASATAPAVTVETSRSIPVWRTSRRPSDASTMAIVSSTRVAEVRSKASRIATGGSITSVATAASRVRSHPAPGGGGAGAGTAGARAGKAAKAT